MRPPRGPRLRPELPRGSSRFGIRPGLVSPAKLIFRSRKTIRVSACRIQGDGLLFRPRRRGDPTTGPEQRETAGMVGPEWRATVGKAHPDAKGQPAATGGRRSSGDPSGSSSDRRPAGRKACTSPATERAVLGPHRRRLRPTASPIGVGSPARRRTGREPREG